MLKIGLKLIKEPTQNITIMILFTLKICLEVYSEYINEHIFKVI
jgi:hypothetical protein